MWLIASFIVGVAGSFAAGRYFQTLAAKQVARAVVWDMVLLTMNAIPVIALFTTESYVAYAVWIAGNGLGTFLVVRRA